MQSLYETIKAHRPNLQLSRKCFLELHYFEAQTIQDDKGRTVKPMMLEYKQAAGSSEASLTLLRTVGLNQLCELLGQRLYLYRVQRSNGGLFYIYVLLHSSPFVKRRQLRNSTKPKQPSKMVSTAPDSDSESTSGVCSGVPDESSLEEPELDTKQQDELYHGKVKQSTFDGRPVKICHFVKSSAAQTDNHSAPEIEREEPIHQIEKQPLNEVSEKIICQNSISKEMILHRLNDIPTLDRLRQYLAFYSKHPTFGYKGETGHSLRVKLASQGIELTDEQLMDIYIEHSLRHGMTEASARLDIENLGHMISTERIIYLQRGREAHKQWMSPYSVTTINIADHGLKRAPGRLDPEACSIM